MVPPTLKNSCDRECFHLGLLDPPLVLVTISTRAKSDTRIRVRNVRRLHSRRRSGAGIAALESSGPTNRGGCGQNADDRSAATGGAAAPYVWAVWDQGTDRVRAVISPARVVAAGFPAIAQFAGSTSTICPRTRARWAPRMSTIKSVSRAASSWR